MDFNISSSLLEKIWDTIADKGISALLRPWQMKRENKARLECLRDERLTMVKIEAEVKQLQASLGKGDDADAKTVSQVTELVSETVTANLREIVREEISVAKAVCYAGEYVNAEKVEDEKPAEVPTEEWLNKWKKRVREFTDEEALMWWGRILAGEFASPGRFSYKFLDWMSCIDSKDAQLVLQLMGNVFGDMYYNGKNVAGKAPLTFGELLELQELGVIQGVETFGIKMTYKTDIEGSFQKALLSANGKEMILVEHPDPSKILEINDAYGLTRIGKEVKMLCGAVMNSDMVQILGRHIVAKGFAVYHADITFAKGNHIRFENKMRIEEP